MLLGAFVAIEARVREPMLPLGLFRRPAFAGVQLAAFDDHGSIFSLFLYLSLYLQNYLGLTPFQAGLRYLPITLAASSPPRWPALLLPQVPARAAAVRRAGRARRSACCSWRGIDAGDELDDAAARLHRRRARRRPAQPGDRRRRGERRPEAQSGMAAGINDTFRQVGVAIGLAVWGAIFVGRAATRVTELTGVPHDSARHLVEGVSSGALSGRGGAVADAAREGFLSGMNEVFVLGAVVALVGALLALTLVRGVGEQELTAAAPTARPTGRPVPPPARS